MPHTHPVLADFLSFTLSHHPIDIVKGQLTNGVHWHYLGDGILEFVPQHGSDQSLVLSAGIHGNETAPIELLNTLVQDIATGEQPLAVRLLMLLGNVAAMRQNCRYLQDDLNRLFDHRHQKLPNSPEAQRAAHIEEAMAQFFDAASGKKYHLDLHTAIRPSSFSRFGLLPYQSRPYDAYLLSLLERCDLGALLINHAPAGTFAYHSSQHHSAESVTLELGKVQPFGQNQLAEFAGINALMRAMVAGTEPTTAAQPYKTFKVVAQLEKHSEDFVLNLPSDVANFTAYPKGTLIASDQGYEYIVSHSEERIVFPNPKVKPGVRAGLMVVEVNN
jgi:succinylglutamate desuccinylase